ncbi:hypothetical protein BDV3_003756 [Batrachochytrium dendrobatidis]
MGSGMSTLSLFKKTSATSAPVLAQAKSEMTNIPRPNIEYPAESKGVDTVSKQAHENTNLEKVAVDLEMISIDDISNEIQTTQPEYDTSMGTNTEAYDVQPRLSVKISASHSTTETVDEPITITNNINQYPCATIPPPSIQSQTFIELENNIATNEMVADTCNNLTQIKECDQEVQNMCFMENMQLEKQLELSRNQILELKRCLADALSAQRVPVSAIRSRDPVKENNGIPPRPTIHSMLRSKPPLIPVSPNQVAKGLSDSSSSQTLCSSISTIQKQILNDPTPTQNELGSSVSDATLFCPFHTQHIDFLETLLAQTSDKLTETTKIYERRCERLKMFLTKQKTESTVRIFELETQLNALKSRLLVSKSPMLLPTESTASLKGVSPPSSMMLHELPPLSGHDVRLSSSKDVVMLKHQLESKDLLIRALSMQVDALGQNHTLENK